jgi:hypothetical protein
MDWISSQDLKNDEQSDYLEFWSNANNEFPCEKKVVYSLLHKKKGMESVILKGDKVICKRGWYYEGQLKAYEEMINKLNK